MVGSQFRETETVGMEMGDRTVAVNDEFELPGRCHVGS